MPNACFFIILKLYIFYFINVLLDGSLEVDTNAALYLEYYYPHLFLKTPYILASNLKDEDYIFYLNPQSLANSSSSSNHNGSSAGMLAALFSIADLSISNDGVA